MPPKRPAPAPPSLAKQPSSRAGASHPVCPLTTFPTSRSKVQHCPACHSNILRFYRFFSLPLSFSLISCLCRPLSKWREALDPAWRLSETRESGPGAHWLMRLFPNQVIRPERMRERKCAKRVSNGTARIHEATGARSSGRFMRHSSKKPSNLPAAARCRS